MNTLQQFMAIVQDVPETDEPLRKPELSSFIRFCSVCFEMTPHKREGNFVECIVCGQREYPHPDISQFEIDASA